jgi:hypothetical protein
VAPDTLPDADLTEAGVFPFDAGVVDAACTPILIDDPLSSINPALWTITSAGNPGHPSVVVNSSLDFVSLVNAHDDGARGGIWLTTTQPTTAFDVQFQLFVACGSHWFDGCGDGFAAAWLDGASILPGGLAPAVNNARDHETFGIPRGMNGNALALDIYTNDSIGDPGTPALEVISVNGALEPATYPWVRASLGYGALTGHPHVLHLQVRKGLLTVLVDGLATSLTDITVQPVQTSVFGLTAATGGENGVFYVWDFHAAFFPCDP